MLDLQRRLDVDLERALPPDRAPSSGPRAASPGSAASGADRPLVDARGATRVALEAGDYYFRPALIRATPGRPLVLAVRNATSTLHTLQVAGQAAMDVAPGRTVELPVTVPAHGTLRFGCTIHDPLGMEGELLAGDTVPTRASH